MQKKFSANLLLKIVVDFKQNDKSEFGEPQVSGIQSPGRGGIW